VRIPEPIRVSEAKERSVGIERGVALPQRQERGQQGNQFFPVKRLSLSTPSNDYKIFPPQKISYPKQALSLMRTRFLPRIFAMSAWYQRVGDSGRVVQNARDWAEGITEARPAPPVCGEGGDSGNPGRKAAVASRSATPTSGPTAPALPAIIRAEKRPKDGPGEPGSEGWSRGSWSPNAL